MASHARDGGLAVSTIFNLLLRSITPYQELVASGAQLVAGALAQVDYDNATDGNVWYTPFLELQFDSGPPAAGTVVVDLYRLPGTTEATERFPEGSATVRPAAVHYVGGFQMQEPSLSVDRLMALDSYTLRAGGNRFIIENVSNNTIAAGWTFGLMLERLRQEQV